MGETAPTWGVITGTCETGVLLQGTPCNFGVEQENPASTALDEPPIQVYVIESVEKRALSHTAIATHLEEAARRSICGELNEPFAIVTGPAAIDLWIEGLATKRIDANTAAALLASLQHAQQSLRRVLTGNVSSIVLARNTEAVAATLDDRSDDNPLPTLQQLRDQFVDLYEAITSSPRA